MKQHIAASFNAISSVGLPIEWLKKRVSRWQLAAETDNWQSKISLVENGLIGLRGEEIQKIRTALEVSNAS